MDILFSIHTPEPGCLNFAVKKRYLPADWLELPADNRHSILDLPDITKDDIEHYYRRFTEIRERRYMKKYGDVMSPEGKAIAKKIFAESAARG